MEGPVPQVDPLNHCVLANVKSLHRVTFVHIFCEIFLKHKKPPLFSKGPILRCIPPPPFFQTP